jgi:hypothetical protein
MNFHLLTTYYYESDLSMYVKLDAPSAINFDHVVEIEFPTRHPDVAYISYSGTESYSTIVSRDDLARLMPVPTAPPPERTLHIH